MATATYTGRAGLRVLLETDGFSRRLEFRPGTPTEVSDEDADLIASTALRAEFTITAPAATDETTQPPAKPAGRTTGKAS